MTENTLVIFVKNPVAGNVKTRIAAKTNDRYALQLYNELLRILKLSLSGLNGWKVVIYYSDFIEKSDTWPFAVSREKQNGKDLGKRMQNAFEQELKKARKVILIGSDIPDLQVSHIQKAGEILQKKDIVIGPTFDGGYYLIGMKKLNRSIFSNIHWGQKDVFSETCKSITKGKLSFNSLPILSDIDEWQDIPEYILRELTD